MDKIVWNDSLSVGVDAIDADHQQLAALINLLVDHTHLPSDAPAVEEILAALGSYTAFHFGREEKHLDGEDIAEARLHVSNHRHFQSTLQQISHGAAQGRIHLGRVCAFLVPWWSSHILDQDMGLRSGPPAVRH